MTINVKPSDLTVTDAPADTLPMVAMARGDGIGPEIMDATLRILEAGGARFDLREVEIGERVYRAGHTSGIAPESWDIIRSARAFLKAPITTPQGGGFKSLNVTLRKSLGLYANIRPVRSLAPFVATNHPGIDLVIVRENEEDLYAGIEHRHTDEVVQCLKILSRPGTEKIVRHAFEFARANGRRKVTCFTKDNIMKLTDGMFHRIFDEIGADYPEIEKDHWIIDIGAARLADRPASFDVIVTLNLYGDIISDIAAEVAGSVGLAGSSNIGDHGAMFEAIHGSAPDIAGRDLANPSGLLAGAVLMLRHLGQNEAAARIENAWLSTIEDGVATADMTAAGAATVGTRAFADAVIARLGRTPVRFPAASGAGSKPMPRIVPRAVAPTVKTLDGVDIFLHHRDRDPDALAARLNAILSPCLELEMITNRGVKVWPHGLEETFKTDHWRCRFKFKTGLKGSVALIAEHHMRLARAGFDVVKTENLCRFDGVAGYSLGQGQ